MNQPLRVILGNSNKRFSGVTSTMLQTMSYQQSLCEIWVLGNHNLPDPSIAINFRQAVQICKESKTPVIFHARRNDEMIQALFLKKLCGANLKILFTSTAQREHSFLTKWLMQQVDAVISTCSAAASYLKDPPVAVIPHGINTNLYTPAQNKQEAWKATGFPGDYGIGIFGRVRKQKGVDLFINACIKNLPKLPGATAIIVGAIDDKELVENSKKKASEANLLDRIIFTGELPFDRIPGLFRSMSLICALSRNEGYGLTVLESLASETPVLATKAGAWPDILADQAVGSLAECDNQSMINQQMYALLQNQKSLASMGRSGRELVLRKYKIEDEARALFNFYKSLI
jgi:mannosyltransferase